MRLTTIPLPILLLSLTFACASPGSNNGNGTFPNAQTAHAAPVLTTPAQPTPPFNDADYTRHVEELQKRIRAKTQSREFSIVIQKPFVVIGDEPESAVRERADGTVKWAVERLKQDFFAKDPKNILEIWLFKDESSYRKHAMLLFGDSPTTPYGYYSSSNRALVMNIGSGGGTLVHEIVHPFVEANFPSCPAWLNEGLGSLYEQCGEVNGHIHGYTNWRLPGLQRAIREDRLQSFKSLMSMDARTFYNDDRGINYAQARYLCYYLQQHGLLMKFYHEFVKNQATDPSGFKTLKRVLRQTDMNAFQKSWEGFVLKLRQGYDVTIQ